VLRLVGFSYEESPVKLEFGFIDLDASETVYTKDDELLWVPSDYESKLRTLEEERPALVFSGDSCTQFGKYGDLLAEQLQREYPDAGLRHANMGVGAWSTYQGRHQLENHVLPLSPRVVTIYFGWNDHWRGLGDEAVARATRWRTSPFYRLRWAQLLTRGYISLLNFRARDMRRRVPIEEFEENLREMVLATRRAGAFPMLLTAPTSYRQGKTYDFLVPHFLAPDDDVAQLHAEYADRVRSVATETGAALCDLLERFDALPARRRASYFTGDGVHLKPSGDAQIARFLRHCFEEHEVVPLLLENQ